MNLLVQVCVNLSADPEVENLFQIPHPGCRYRRAPQKEDGALVSRRGYPAEAEGFFKTSEFESFVYPHPDSYQEHSFTISQSLSSEKLPCVNPISQMCFAENENKANIEKPHFQGFPQNSQSKLSNVPGNSEKIMKFSNGMAGPKNDFLAFENFGRYLSTFEPATGRAKSPASDVEFRLVIEDQYRSHILQSKPSPEVMPTLDLPPPFPPYQLQHRHDKSCQTSPVRTNLQWLQPTNLNLPI
jgi:hypothetical protein